MDIIIRRCVTSPCSGKALNFAIEQEVDVINLALGGPPDPLLARLVGKAVERNILVIGAVSPKWPGGFPAGVEGVVAVTTADAKSGENAQTGNAGANHTFRQTCEAEALSSSS